MRKLFRKGVVVYCPVVDWVSYLLKIIDSMAEKGLKTFAMVSRLFRINPTTWEIYLLSIPRQQYLHICQARFRFEMAIPYSIPSNDLGRCTATYW